MTTPGLPPLFGLPWEAQATEESTAQEHLRSDVVKWLQRADEALAEANDDAATRAATFPAGSADRITWGAYVTRIYQFRAELQKFTASVRSGLGP